MKDVTHFRFATLVAVALLNGCGGYHAKIPIQSSVPTASYVGTPGIDVDIPVVQDAGADLVASFYTALFQKNDPTLIQDEVLFSQPESWREVLVKRGKLNLNQPLLCWFRSHKELFVPKHMQSLAHVHISSTFIFNRDVLERLDLPSAGQGYVLVFHVNDELEPNDKPPGHFVLFVLDDGKIAPDAIRIDGSGLTISEFYSLEK